MSRRRQQRLRPADFAGGVWHGGFLAAGLALADPIALLPGFIDRLTGSAVWVGGLTSLMAAATAAPQILVARFVEPLRHKKPVLLLAVYVRAAAWGALAALVALGGSQRPGVLLASLVGLLTLFALAGAVGGVPYVDLIGKVIPRHRRGLFFASRQAAGSVLGLGASVLAGVLLTLSYPGNYAALFAVSATLLVIASLGVWVVREPPSEVRPVEPWSVWVASLKAPVGELLPLAGITWATSASFLALPTYVVVAISKGAPDHAMAWFIAANVLGGLASNVVWARLVDTRGAPAMIRVCVSLAVLAPLLALISLRVGWPVLVGVMALAGATQTGRKVGFSAALLELAPPERRATYGATYALLCLPAAAMPLVGGLLVAWTSYATLFVITAVLLTAALVVVTRWARPERPRGGADDV